MPDLAHEDDARLRSMGRIPVIRALLASRAWPYMSSLSVSERERALDDMALRQYEWELFLG